MSMTLGDWGVSGMSGRSLLSSCISSPAGEGHLELLRVVFSGVSDGGYQGGESA